MKTTRPHSRSCTRKRGIISSDAKNEADDQHAIAHAPLTPSFDVRGMVAGHFGAPGSMQRSLDEMKLIANLPGDVWEGPVLAGTTGPLESLNDSSSLGDGAALIVSETLRGGRCPPCVLCMGALTDVALALRACPEIASRLSVVWVGGVRYPAGGHETNLARDLQAAREVFSSRVQHWQIPSEAYKTLVVPMSQPRLRVAAMGELGVGRPGCGRSPCRAARPPRGASHTWDCPRLPEPGRRIRVCHTLDDRLTLEDFFC